MAVTKATSPRDIRVLGEARVDALSRAFYREEGRFQRIPTLAVIGGPTAGELPNNTENLMKWIQHPHQIHPRTAMPEMGVSDQDARDISAFLYTLK